MAQTPARRWSFNHLRQLLPTATIPASSNPAQLTSVQQDLTGLAFSDQANQQHDVQQFLKASHTDAFAVMHRGQLVFDWFDGFGAADRPHIIFSVTKSMAALLAGVLVGRGMLDPEKLVTYYLPELSESAYVAPLFGIFWICKLPLAFAKITPIVTAFLWPIDGRRHGIRLKRGAKLKACAIF